MEDERWSRLSMLDRIRRFEKPREPERKPRKAERKPEREAEREPGWSLSEAMEIGASILALMER